MTQDINKISDEPLEIYRAHQQGQRIQSEMIYNATLDLLIKDCETWHSFDSKVYKDRFIEFLQQHKFVDGQND